MEKLYQDARALIDKSIEANLPQAAVRNALKSRRFSGPVPVLAIGKAAWTMANATAAAAQKELKAGIKKGIVITKYGHAQGAIPGFEIIEAGHPLSDENTIKGTEKALEMARSLSAGDELLFLISGGGSALFER
jgi:hydroxypyruvate reductase